MISYIILDFYHVYVPKQLRDVLQMYAMLERVSPRTRKLELFARMHNVQAGYVFFISCQTFIRMCKILSMKITEVHLMIRF